MRGRAQRGGHHIATGQGRTHHMRRRLRIIVSAVFVVLGGYFPVLAVGAALCAIAIVANLTVDQPAEKVTR